MIFVTVGTIQYPFNRLARAVNEYASKNPKERVVIQSGYTETFEKASNVSNKNFYTFEKMQDLIEAAHLVITQGGEGSVYQALNLSKNPPIVVPRNPQFGEHVDTQQLEIASAIRRRRLAVVSTNPEKLVHAIKNYTMLSSNLAQYRTERSDKKTLINYLTSYVADLTK